MRGLAFSTWRRTATPIFLAAVSLLAAVVLWVAVTDAQNPNKIAVFSGGIEVQAVNLPQGIAVASIRQPVVSLRISASESTFAKLTAADFRAEVDMSGVRQSPSDQVVIARVVTGKNVQIVDVSPAVVSVVTESEVSKQVPVRAHIAGSPGQGFSIPPGDVIVANPSTVKVSGAASLIQLVVDAEADVNLTGLRVNLQQQFPLTARDARGADIRSVRIEPANADIRVPITQQDVTLTLPVTPLVQGTVADGYNIAAVTSDPSVVVVSGPLEALQAVTSISTEPIDVSSQRADITRSVRLRLPVGVQLSRDSVSVRVKITPAQGEITQALAPQVTNLGSGLRATLQTSTITVRLAGDLPTLRTMTAGAVRATVSAEGLDEGVHVLTATITAPEGVRIVSADTTQVVVVLRR